MFDKLSQLWRRLLFYLRRSRFDRELEEEMRFHLEMKAEENRAAGTSPEEARYAAQRQLGNQTVLREVSRDMWAVRSIETLFQDLRYGARTLLKNSGFTLIVVLTLGLGIGANTAIFSLVDAVLLRPLPFHDPDRLVMVWEDSTGFGGVRDNSVAPANYTDWKAQNRVFEDMVAIDGRSFNLTDEGEPERVEAYAVTANFFPLLGVEPELGRVFTGEEDQPGRNNVALISYGLWQQRFGGDPALIGKEITLDGQKHVVIGVLPSGFQFMSKETSLWVPIAFRPQELADRGSHYLRVVARIKQGITLQEAHADIAAIMQRTNRDHPTPFEFGSTVISLREQLAGGVRPALILLLAAVGFVLLIACANIANLLLARGTARYREIAVRAALGAGRQRIVRQLLTESLLLAVAGGTAGLLFAWLSFSFLKQIVPAGMALNAGVRIDARIFGFTLLLSFLTGIVFGLLPALQAAKVDLNEALKQSGGRAGTGGGHRRLRSALVVIEVALALVLLVGAGLLINAFLRLRSLDIGVNAENVLTLRTTLSRNKYGELPKRDAFYRQVLERVRALPGVVSAGYTTAAPLTWKGGTSSFAIEGREQGAGQDAQNRQVSAGYMETMGVKLRRGRFFDERDGAHSQPVAMINETMARQFWPGENALGRRFKLGWVDSRSPWVMIVGVVGDMKEMGLDAPAKAEMFFPYQQMPNSLWNMPRDLMVRTTGDPMSVAAAVRQAVWSVDGNQPVSNIRTMDEILSEDVAQRRIGMMLLASFAALALALASLGIYGVLSYSVTQRTQEIGIRMALGAGSKDVLWMVLADGMRLAAAGIAIGLGASFALTHLMEALLFEVSATDPLTFALIAALLTGVALLACWIPARRAARVNPMTSLRFD
jgi:predicted permease